MNYSVFVSCAKGLEYLLAEELAALGFHAERVSPQGVFGEANLAMLYHICIWSRIANRVQVILFSGQAHNEQTLYQLCHEFAWQTVFSPSKTFAIAFNGSSKDIRNSMYGAQVVKDAIVDHFRNLNNSRPTVARENPEILIHAYLKNDELTVSFDMTGYSLHQRGYRTQAGDAPLKETLAAAMLMRAKWPELALQGYGLHDPFCGSGTLVIEAAMMAAQIAPGLIRHDQALVHWAAHEPALWTRIREQALQMVKPITGHLSGSDTNSKLIPFAEANAERAGVHRLVRFEQQTVKNCRPNGNNGLLIANPPYGERLGEATHLIPLYQEFGEVAHAYFQGWQVAFLCSNPLLAKAVGLRAGKQYTLYNGALECKLYCLKLDEANRLKNATPQTLSEGATMLLNRLRKNQQHLSKWSKKNNISCYRVYDADLPEYAYAIDLYDGYALLQEYAAPNTIPSHKVEKRSLEVMQVVPMALSIATDKLIIKQRKQQKGKEQYQKIAQQNRTMVVQEGKARLKINLYDYLDTGLFLDHRLLRLRFEDLHPATRFLNCFCYTATASVHAALAGAITTNVDMSRTYLQWAEENFRLNQINLARHQFIQANCMSWLNTAKGKYDVIFLDPPSFSNSKRMEGTLDVQRDHINLIEQTMGLLEKDGVMYFSTNFRQFKLADAIKETYQVKDISSETIDEDFKRNQRIHQCFVIRHKAEA